jgi:hypothetical protein
MPIANLARAGMDVASSPLGQLLFTILGGNQQQKAFDEAKQGNLDLLDRILSGSESLEGDLISRNHQQTNQRLREMSRLRAELTGALGAGQEGILSNQRASNEQLQSGLAQLAGSINSGFADRTQQGLALLENLGQQSKRDVDERFDVAQDRTTADLTRRGLGSSTVLSSNRLGTERERSAEQRRLDDQIARQRFGAFSQLTGDELASRSNLGLAQTDLGSRLAESLLGRETTFLNQRHAADSALALERFNQLTRGQDERRRIMESMGLGRLGVLEGVNIPIPQGNTFLELARQAGVASAPTPDTPSTFENLAPGLIQGGSSMLAAKIFVGCLDGDCLIETPNGKVKLRDLSAGDEVTGADGEPDTVVYRDFGEPHPGRKNEYIRITTDLSTIVLTRDHVISGKDAEQWKPDEVMDTPVGKAIVESIERVDAVPSGDLLLARSADYIANGFYVTSMIQYYGLASELECMNADHNTTRT